MIAAQNSTALEIVVALSIFVPVIVTAALAWWVLRGKRSDPDEQLWKLQDDERHRREAQREPE